MSDWKFQRIQEDITTLQQAVIDTQSLVIKMGDQVKDLQVIVADLNKRLTDLEDRVPYEAMRD